MYIIVLYILGYTQKSNCLSYLEILPLKCVTFYGQQNIIYNFPSNHRQGHLFILMYFSSLCATANEIYVTRLEMQYSTEMV